MELSVGITKGFHNAPKLWGDDTVRPQEKVKDFKSGIKAVGREFGFGWYDGITGLFTQPWKGAQKEGASGFFKGFGKGIGGFITKPGAALFGIPSHMMKGVHKEVQKLFGNSVQNYIVTSRTAQGYQEWLQSSEAEKEDVIDRWKMIQTYLKKTYDADRMMQDILEAQRKGKMKNGVVSQDYATTADTTTQDSESATISTRNLHYPLHSASTDFGESLGATEVNGSMHQSVQDTSRENPEEDSGVDQGLLEAMASSEAEAQRHASEALEHEEQLKQVMAQSLTEHGQMDSDRERENLDSERTKGMTEYIARKAVPVANGSSDTRTPPAYDQGHVEGTTQDEFWEQYRGEKTVQEKTEEEIVMEYVKKQSLLEAHHQNKGKGRAVATEDEDEEDLQKALSLSMQGRG
jgi:hypothetical protein